MAMHCLIAGKVQGVGYRAWTLKQAKSLSLTGWVRNLPSGDVETLVHGDDEAVKTFIFSLHKGPVFAKVKYVMSHRINEHSNEHSDSQQFVILDTPSDNVSDKR